MIEKGREITGLFTSENISDSIFRFDSGCDALSANCLTDGIEYP
jgi:hypothetical protein